MEILTLRDYFVRYADDSIRLQVHGFVFSIYALLILLPVAQYDADNLSPLLFVTLAFTLVALFHWQKSRLMAFSIIVYGAIIGTIQLLSGYTPLWFLFAFSGVGFWKIAHKLHYQYTVFQETGAIQQYEPTYEKSDGDRAEYKVLFITFLPLLVLFPLTAATSVILSPWFLNSLAQTLQSVSHLLTLYYISYSVLIALLLVSTPLVLAAVVLSFRKGARNNRLFFSLRILAVVVIVGIGTALLWKENAIGVLNHLQSDLQQLKSGNLNKTTIWLYPSKGEHSPLGLQITNKNSPFILYTALNIEEEKKEQFYIPKLLNFSLDAVSAYDERRSIRWNTENTTRFYIEYTNNLDIITSIHPIS